MYKLNRIASKDYCEIGQTNPIKFSFINKMSEEEGTEVFTPFMCRDFFSDALYATEAQKTFGVYGFFFNPTKQKYDTDKTRLGIYFPSESTLNQFVKNFAGLVKLEVANNIKPSTMLSIDSRTILLEGDSYWQSRAYLLSFYTALVRYFSEEVDIHSSIVPQIAKKQSTDGSHIRRYKVERQLTKFSENIRLMDKYDYGAVGNKSDSSNVIHDGSGILGCLYTGDSNKYGEQMVKEFA